MPRTTDSAEKPSPQTPEEHKLALWRHCIEGGWRLVGQNCLESLTTSGGRVRLNFRDEEVLRLENRRPLTEEELKDKPFGTLTWDVLEQAPYTDVTIGDNGNLQFKKDKKEASSQKGED